MAIYPEGAVHRPANNFVWDTGTLAWVVETQPGGAGGGGAVTIADAADVAQGALADAAVITDAAGTISGKLRGLVKWAFERMPASLGQKLMAASFPVTLASDQSSLAVTASAGTNLNTSALALDATLTGRTQKTQITDGTRDGTVKAASTAALATDTAFVVAVRDKILVTPDSVALPANQSVNVAQFGGSASTTGNGPGGAGVPRVTTSLDDQVTSVTITASVLVGAGATPGTTPSTNTGSIVMPTQGMMGCAGVVQASAAFVGTLSFEQSYDGGTTWSLMIVQNSSNTQIASIAGTGVVAEQPFHCLIGSNPSHVRVRCSAFTSGSIVVWMRASRTSSVFTVGALPMTQPGQTVTLFAQTVGGRALTGALPTAVATGQGVYGLWDVYGRLVTRQRDTWSITHAPAAATQATIAQGAGAAGVKNVCTSISISLASSAAATLGVVQFNLRDGASGAGTILQSWRLSISATAGDCRVLTLNGLWIEGTAATAMTLETSAAPAAATFATVAMTGTITQ